MSDRYPGGIVVANPTAPAGPYQDGAAPGIWTLEQQAYYKAQGLWPIAGNANPGDPYFDYVTMLLTGNGTNGAQNNTFLDSSSNAFSITRNGNTTQGSFSPYGSLWGVDFTSSSSSYQTVAHTSGIDLDGQFCIEMWCNQTKYGATGNNRFYQKGDNQTNGFCLLTAIATNKVFFGRTDEDLVSFTQDLRDGLWHHIAVTRQSDNYLRIYLDGVLKNTSSSTYSDNLNNTGALYIARYPGDTSVRYAGLISNLRIVKGSSVYSGSSFTVPTTPLTAISGTGCLVCQSNRPLDNSSNAATVSQFGSAAITRFSPFNPTTAYDTATIGGSGYFDGTSYLTSSNSGSVSSGQNFTAEGWVYLNQATDNTEIFACAADLSVIQTASGQNIYSYDGSFHSWGKSMPLGRWCHLVMMRSGGTAYTWVDGVYATSFSYSGSWSWNGTGHPNFTIINNNDNHGLGYWADWRFSTTARYNTSGSNITVPTAPLTSDANTTFLLQFTNAGIPDSAMMNDLQTVGNAQVSTSVKKYGTGSISFDGTSDGLIAPASPNAVFGTGNFTIEWWQYWNSTSGYQTIYSNNYISANNLLIQTGDGTGKYRVFMNDTNATLTETNAASTGQWYHYALVRNGSTLTMYRDGTANGSVTSSASVGVATVITEIGQGNSSFSINGYIDDFRITKGYARYTANFTPPTSAFYTY